MSDLIHHLEGDVSDWFHRHARHDGSPASDGDTITTGETQAPPSPGDIVSLAALAASMKTDLEELLVRGHNLADQYMPQVVAIGEKVENDDLIQAVEAAVLPPEARALVAEFITKLSAVYPQPAPAVAAPAEPAQEAA